MQITAIHTPLIEIGDDLLSVLLSALDEPLQSGDVITVVSKVVALEQGRLVDLATVTPSLAALTLSPDYPVLAELLLHEADAILGGVAGIPFFLTLKGGLLTPNAGIDQSNAPAGKAILWPQDPWRWARIFWDRLRAHFGLADLGVVITDSHLTPLRRGVTGIALAWAGFEGIESKIGASDLYGRPLTVTEKAVADDLASATVLLTGEADERLPFARVRGAPIHFTERIIDPREVAIDPALDLYASTFNETIKTRLQTQER
jgi:coenzyme F420-0:L-glutamate ligase